MGCWISKKVYKFPKEGLHLYSKEGRMLYTLIYSDDCEYLLMNSVSHDVVKLCRIDNMCMGNDHIVIDGWVSPGWWISACWFFMFDETHKRLMGNNFLVSAHYLRIELSKMTLTRRHKKMGIEYLVSIGTFCNGESTNCTGTTNTPDKGVCGTFCTDGDLTVFSEVMYGLK